MSEQPQENDSNSLELQELFQTNRTLDSSLPLTYETVSFSSPLIAAPSQVPQSIQEQRYLNTPENLCGTPKEIPSDSSFTKTYEIVTITELLNSVNETPACEKKEKSLGPLETPMHEDGLNACSSSTLNFEPVNFGDSLNDNPATLPSVTPTCFEEPRSISKLETVFSTSLNLESSRNSSTPDFVRSVKFTKHWIMNPSSHRIVRLSSRDQGTLYKSENMLPVSQNASSPKSSSTQNFNVVNFPDSPNINPPTASMKGLTCIEEGSPNTPHEIVLDDRLFDGNAEPEVIVISKRDFGKYPELKINTSKRKFPKFPYKVWGLMNPDNLPEPLRSIYKNGSWPKKDLDRRSYREILSESEHETSAPPENSESTTRSLEESSVNETEDWVSTFIPPPKSK